MESHKDINAEIRRLNKEIDCIPIPQPRGSSSALSYVLVIALVVVLGASIYLLGPEITGLVTFSESVVKVESEPEVGSFSVQESGNVDVMTGLENINSIMLSGNVRGKGTAAVFLTTPERDYLAYYFEGDATGDGGVEFRDMCYDTCHIQGLGQTNTLKFVLQGTTMDIDRIKYMYSRIIDFDLEPRRFAVDYDETPVRMIDLKLTNNQLTDYTVLLYIDGPLSDSFSWQGSLIHMNPDEPERYIPITVKLPSNLPEGEYTHKLTARYVPPDTHDFVGESPVAETFVTIYHR